MVLVLKNKQMENLLPMAEEIAAIEQALRELGQGKAMNAPRAQGRQRDHVIQDNTGMGIQFAATARKMYDKAKEKGIGAELPLDLSMTRRGDKLFSPRL